MTSTTPTHDPNSRRTRSKSPRSRPTTPLRPSSRSSFRDSASRARGPYGSEAFPLENLETPFAELSDEMATLEENFQRLQLMHESLARFSESFAGFLYGLNMNAFCVDFPETPIPESFKRPQNNPNAQSTDPLTTSLNRHRNSQGYEADMEATFLTTDTSFVDNPPSSKASKFSTPAPQKPSGIPGRGRGGIPVRGGRGGGIPVRGAGRGVRGGSGIGRGGATTTGRGRALR